MEVLPAFLIPMQQGSLGVGRSVRLAGKTGVHHPPLPSAKILELQEERSGHYCKTKKLVSRSRFMGEEDSPAESNHLGLQVSQSSRLRRWKNCLAYITDTWERSHPGPNSPGTVKIPPKDCFEGSLDFHCGDRGALGAPALVIRR